MWVSRQFGGGAFRVVAVQRLLIVGAFVAEDGAERLELIGVPDQLVPIKMSDLVAEVAEQRAIGLVHARAQLLALGVIGFLESDGDDAIVMPGNHLLLRDVIEKIEHERLGLVGARHRQRQSQLEQRVEQPALGRLQLRPQRMARRVRHVRDGPVVPAGAAEWRAGGICLDQPVARSSLPVRAKSVALLRPGQRDPFVAIGRDGAERLRAG